MILLDTHVLIWMIAQPEKLSRTAQSAIRRAQTGGGLGIADISIWEMAFLFMRGVLRSHGTIENTIQNLMARSGVVAHPITPEIAALAAQFGVDYPKDPVDRIIGATARIEGIALVTRDEKIRSSLLVKTIW